MKFNRKNPPRVYRVGADGEIAISDLGTVELAPDEQLTFMTPTGKPYDFTAKEWGFYATQSINGRVRDAGFKTALVRNEQGRIYVMVVDEARRGAFDAYCEGERQTVLEWLDER
ncbi:MAG: hypothetical protein WD270_09585 [Acetobacterales bacterium]